MRDRVFRRKTAKYKILGARRQLVSIPGVANVNRTAERISYSGYVSWFWCVVAHAQCHAKKVEALLKLNVARVCRFRKRVRKVSQLCRWKRKHRRSAQFVALSVKV